MSHFFSSRLLLTYALLLLASISPAIATQDDKAQLRIICISSLAENQEVVIASLHPEGKAVPCYDRYVSSNPNARNMLFLQPDKTLGVRVSSLPLFGEFK